MIQKVEKFNNVYFRNEEYYGKYEKNLGIRDHGEVKKYCDGEDEKSVVIKEFKCCKNNGITQNAIREICLLTKLKHPNIIKMVDILNFEPSNVENLKIVLEFYDDSLENRLSTINQESIGYIKRFLYQLAKGLCYLHMNGIWHRDIKPANILLNKGGNVVIADFDISRFGIVNKLPITGEVTTLWYRAPEIFLGVKNYNSKVDVYSLGMVFIAIIIGDHYLKGQSENEMYKLIVEYLGNLSEDDWPGISNMENYKYISDIAKKKKNGKIGEDLEKVSMKMGKECIDLLIKMTKPNPSNRISIEEVLNHPFFDLGIVNSNDSIQILKDNMFNPYIDVLPDFSLKNQKQINNSQMLYILYEWMYYVKNQLELEDQTFIYARRLVDLYLNTIQSPNLKKSTFQLIGVSSLSLASKIYEIYPNSVETFSYISDYTSSKENIIKCEYSILKALRFKLVFPTILSFIDKYINGLKSKTLKLIKYLALYLTIIPEFSQKYSDDVLAQLCIKIAIQYFNDSNSKCSSHIQVSNILVENTVKFIQSNCRILLADYSDDFEIVKIIHEFSRNWNSNQNIILSKDMEIETDNDSEYDSEFHQNF